MADRPRAPRNPSGKAGSSEEPKSGIPGPIKTDLKQTRPAWSFQGTTARDRRSPGFSTSS